MPASVMSLPLFPCANRTWALNHNVRARKSSQRETSVVYACFSRSHMKFKLLTRFSVTVEDSSPCLHARGVRGVLPHAGILPIFHPISLSLSCADTRTGVHARQPELEPLTTILTGTDALWRRGAASSVFVQRNKRVHFAWFWSIFFKVEKR